MGQDCERYRELGWVPEVSEGEPKRPAVVAAVEASVRHLRSAVQEGDQAGLTSSTV